MRQRMAKWARTLDPPAMDLRMITQELAHAKELVQSVMEELRRAKHAPDG